MNEKITQGRAPLFAALAAATAVATAALPAHAQENGGTPAPANGPANPNPGGGQGQTNGEQPSQTTGTPTGAAAQGESATQGGTPAAQQGAGGQSGRSGLPGLNGGQQRTPGNPRVSVSTSNALTPIINRAQDMLRTADARKIDAPGGAAQSYSKASSALRQMLSAAGNGSSASNSLPASGSARATASMSSFPLTSEQVTQDIRVLRSLAMQGRNGRAAAGGMSSSQLTQLASLYATGSKEFFTGQLREALLEPASRVSLRLGNSRVEGGQVATSAGGGTGAARVRSDRPELPFPVTLQQPAPTPATGAEGMEGAAGMALNPDGTPVAGTSVAGSAALPAGPVTGEAGVPALVPPGEAPQVVVPGAAAQIAPGVVGTLPFGGAITPNIQFAPVPGYGGYFFGPQVLIQGLYPQQFTGNLYRGY